MGKAGHLTRPRARRYHRRVTQHALAAIDFGISNTDAVSRVGDVFHRWSRASAGPPDIESVHTMLSASGTPIAAFARIAVTGGRHRTLPDRLPRRLPHTTADLPLIAVNELTAIGRGGQAVGLAPHDDPATPLLVVSAGSGTAVVAARHRSYAHVTGSGVGGGTLLGLGRLLLGSTDASDIDALAQRGDANGADLSLRDVISGPIGALPPDATAVNFGRLAHAVHDASREDLAAALMTLVGQVIAITAINAARAERLERVVVIGHMTDMPNFRAVLDRVGAYYGMELTLPAHGGFATALGALLHAAEANP